MKLEYFMDKCTEWEINDVISLIPYLDKNSWEQTRLVSYILAQVNSRKKLSQQDICKFKWEENDNSMNDIEISDEDIQRLRKLSEEKWQTQGIELSMIQGT